MPKQPEIELELLPLRFHGETYWHRCDSPNDLDIKVCNFFRSKEIEKGFYIECGANNGIFQSNTFLLEQAGWTGILIEADPQLAYNCSNYRENNIVQNAALVSSKYVGSTVEGLFSKYYSKDYREMNDLAKDLNDTERKDFFGEIYQACLTGQIIHDAEDRSDKIPEHLIKKEVPAATLFSILQTYNIKPWAIDFFSLDVEGMELDVLDGLNLQYYRPKYILVEILEDEKKSEIESLMRDNKYEEIANFSNHDIMYEAQ